jgi:hypothetical protein
MKLNAKLWLAVMLASGFVGTLLPTPAPADVIMDWNAKADAIARRPFTQRCRRDGAGIPTRTEAGAAGQRDPEAGECQLSSTAPHSRSETG